jgi:hypothetical protein
LLSGVGTWLGGCPFLNQQRLKVGILMSELGPVTWHSASVGHAEYGESFSIENCGEMSEMQAKM